MSASLTGDPATLSVSDFFKFTDKNGLIQSKIEEAVAANANRLLSAAFALVPGQFQAIAREGVAHALSLALDGPLHAFLVKAWDDRRDLKEFCKAETYPADRTIAYDLKETLTTLVFTPGVQ